MFGWNHLWVFSFFSIFLYLVCHNFSNKYNKMLLKAWRKGSNRGLTETRRLSLGQLKWEPRSEGKLGMEFLASEGSNWTQGWVSEEYTGQRRAPMPPELGSWQRESRPWNVMVSQGRLLGTGGGEKTNVTSFNTCQSECSWEF